MHRENCGMKSPPMAAGVRGSASAETLQALQSTEPDTAVCPGVCWEGHGQAEGGPSSLGHSPSAH